MKRPKPSTPVLNDTMTREQIVAVLNRLVFTAAHNWQRTIIVDRNVRDLIVRTLNRGW